jgi:outer membrane lipoprotein-sorting protein
VQPPAAKKDAAPTPPSGLQLTPTGTAAAAPQDATNSEARQRALVERINGYLTNMQTLVGDFVQVGPDGARTEGQFFIQKPGKVRFEYKPPSRVDVIADGQSVVVRDRKLSTQDLYPLSQTPLRYLLSDRIDLGRDTNLVSVAVDDVFVTLVIEEKQFVGTNRLVLMFGAKDLQLRQWTVTDPQGYDTTVAVYNLDTNKKPDPDLFKINYDNPDLQNTR